MCEYTKIYNPVKLCPAFKDYLWGGDRLRLLYNKYSKNSIIAESWELSTHKDGQSKIADCSCCMETLQEYIQNLGKDIMGLKVKTKSELPILIKLIDARDDLSVQVHPDNEYANKFENDNGKTEMWVILENEPNAFLFYGVKKAVTKEEMKIAIEKDTVLELLRKVSVHKGDVFFIPAGTIHAIGKGMVICEIQQCSNVTYRLYDYGRKDKEGNERDLHIQKALDVAILEPQQLYLKAECTLYQDENTTVQILRSSLYFNVYMYSIKRCVKLASSKETFIALIVLNGSGSLEYANKNMKFQKGETIFMPAQELEYEIFGSCEILVVML